jgi:DNA-binding CsgD family transcriptional regulator
MLMSEHARARDCCEQAIAVASSVGARVHEAGALNSLGSTLMALGELPAGIERLRQARAIARQDGDPQMLGRTATGLSDGLRKGGRLAEAVEVGLEGAREAQRAGLQLYEGFCRLNAAESAFELGRWELVDDLVGDVLADEVAGVTLIFAHHMSAAVAIARGEFDAADHHLAGERGGAGPHATPELAVYESELEVELALWRGQPEAGAHAADEGLRRIEGREPQLWALIALLGVRAQADRAELARARRDEAAAGAACERARDLREGARERREARRDDPIATTIEAECARALGRADPSLWKLAADAWEARPCPYRAAYARWRQAEAALQSDRDRPQATTALAAAHATATSLGAVPLRDEIVRLARRARIALPADEPDGAQDEAASPAAGAEELGLTPREREVLERLALGETNRQIAEALFISARTAGVHVSRILSKLGASNRSEAAAIAHRLGLVS